MASRCTILVVCVLQAVALATDPTGTYCNGTRQSPINIVTKQLVKTRLPKLEFNRGYSETPLTQKIHSDEHSITLVGTFKNQPAISGGPLKTSYNLHSLHFHWGVKNSEGSEHLFNNEAYSMEMHVVHTKPGLSFDEAKKVDDGLVVIGYFTEVSWGISLRSNPFRIITTTMQSLKEPNTPVDLVRLFEMTKLVVPFERDYVTYNGSLTTGNCEEVVTWIVAQKVLKLTRAQIDVFRNLKPRHLVHDATNYRSVQALNGRTVYLSTKWA